MNKVIGKDYRLYANTVRLVAIEDEKIVYWSYDNGKYDWLHPSNIKILNDIESTEDKEPTKPLYTTKMKEAGEMPSVGMIINPTIRGLCEIEHIYNSCGETYYLYRSKKDIVYCDVIESGWIRPIDTRTDKEKAVTELMGEQQNLIGNIDYMEQCFGIAYDKWSK